jgi:hypothetical protein
MVTYLLLLLLLLLLLVLLLPPSPSTPTKFAGELCREDDTGPVWLTQGK